MCETFYSDVFKTKDGRSYDSAEQADILYRVQGNCHRQIISYYILW